MTRIRPTLNGKNLEHFVQSIQHNCDISDASGSSLFSICGMALRLRDLNKWELGLKPWEENNKAQLVNWIDQKETLWEKREGQPLHSLLLSGNIFDPFETQKINEILSSGHLFYGAGYAHSLKPTFFLARIQSVSEIDDIPVYILENELVRDLLTLPALNQDNIILIRQDSARLFLWDQMVYLKKSGRNFLEMALTYCGLPDSGLKSRKHHFDTILSVQQQAYIHHEIGEIKDSVFDHQDFRHIISDFPHTPVELLARTVKDLLADCGPDGVLNHFIRTENEAGLAFYAAFQDGLFLPLFPEYRPALNHFFSDKNWGMMDEVREKGFNTARGYIQDLLALCQEKPAGENKQQVIETIHQKLIQPLIGS